MINYFEYTVEMFMNEIYGQKSTIQETAEKEFLYEMKSTSKTQENLIFQSHLIKGFSITIDFY